MNKLMLVTLIFTLGTILIVTGIKQRKNPWLLALVAVSGVFASLTIVFE